MLVNTQVAYTVPFNSSSPKYRGRESMRSTCYNAQGYYLYSCKRTPEMVALELPVITMHGGHTKEVDQYGRKTSHIYVDLFTMEVS